LTRRRQAPPAAQRQPRTAAERRRLSKELAIALLSEGDVPEELVGAWRFFWMARWGLVRQPSFHELMSWPARLVGDIEVVAQTVADAREARLALMQGPHGREG
jgi:hypothetical protein